MAETAVFFLHSLTEIQITRKFVRFTFDINTLEH